MGCDIHVHAERRVNGSWVHVGELDVNRDYELFWLLGAIDRRANRKIKPLAPYRGIPADVTPATDADHRSLGEAAHSATWLSLAELRACVAANPALQKQSFWGETVADLGLCTLHADCGESETLARACIAHPDDVRVVLWFDS